GHREPVGHGLGLDRAVQPDNAAPHRVEVALVLEADLDHAVREHAGGAHLVLWRSGLAVEGPADGFHQRRLAAAVAAVDAEDARRQLELEVVVDPEVAEGEGGEAHQSVASSTARARYSRPRSTMRRRSKP